MDEMTLDLRSIAQASSLHAPSGVERALGLWLDRTGEAWDSEKPNVLRLLNNYGVIEVIEGAGHFYSPLTGWRDVRAGDAILLFPDIPHFYQANCRWHTRWIVFNGPLADRFREAGCLTPEEPVVTKGGNVVRETFRDLQRRAPLDRRDRAVERFRALSQMLVRLHQKRAGGQAPDPLLERIENYIRDHCTERLSPEAIARRFGISYSHLRRILRERTGGSIKDAITAARLDQAKTLLMDTNLPPKQIAETVGYPDYLYFMRVFRRHVGMTVGTYRRLHQQPNG